MRTAQDSVKETKFLYQRGSVLSERQQYRRNAVERERANATSAHSQPISRFFSSHTTPESKVSPSGLRRQNRQEAIKDLEKKLCSKKEALQGQNLTRHRAVLALLCMMEPRSHGETREELSYQVSRAYKKGVYARKIVK
jgi:hypothetical protein